MVAPQSADPQRQLRKWKILAFATGSSTLILILAAIGFYLWTNTKARTSGQSLKEVMQEMRQKHSFLIKDSSAIKAIAVDSLSFIDEVQTPSQDIFIDKQELFNKITATQENKLKELRRLELLWNNGVPGFRLTITSKSFTPLTSIAGERDGPFSNEILAYFRDHCSNPAQHPFLMFGGIQLKPTVRKMDIRQFGLSFPTFEQGNDPSCWAVAAAKALDISYQIRHRVAVTSSQQQIMDCSKGGNADGGASYLGFKWMQEQHIKLNDSSDYPYNGRINTCRAPVPPGKYELDDWSLIFCTAVGAIANKDSIKSAICRFGCVVSSVKTTPVWSHYGTDFVIKDNNIYRKADNSYDSDHSVLIIGWDDDRNAWLIKNSWGDDWGITAGLGSQRGYMWLDYNSCNIGKMAAWVVAR